MREEGAVFQALNATFHWRKTLASVQKTISKNLWATVTFELRIRIARFGCDIVAATGRSIHFWMKITTSQKLNIAITYSSQWANDLNEVIQNCANSLRRK